MNNILGIDNGISGALALIGGDLGNLVTWLPMPISKTRKGHEIDVLAIDQWLAENNVNADNTTVIIEEPGGSKSAKAASSMAGSFHSLRALFSLRSFRWHRLTPQAWQKPLLKCKAGDTKAAALTMARALWPQERWLVSERCRVPHDGAVDASLLAEFGRRTRL